MKMLVILMLGIFTLNACGAEKSSSQAGKSQKENFQAADARPNTENRSGTEIQALPSTNEKAEANSSESVESQIKQPRTVRDFFNLLPQKYFTLEGCVDNPTRSNCERARRDYVNSFLEVEDTANGYWKSGCDGGQSCLTMALFKRPNGTYIVALTVTTEMQDNNHFLEYRNGKWFDVGGQVVPNFSRKNIYELPRQGTTMQVFAKKIVDEGDGFEAAERGAKLYDLVWSGGKFSIRK